ncbi:unnamed protein product [Closterium sp. NIES-65]|nr:unnamed protein product [Closterium sp. NIES-65]
MWDAAAGGELREEGEEEEEKEEEEGEEGEGGEEEEGGKERVEEEEERPVQTDMRGGGGLPYLVIVLADDKLFGRKKVVSICREAVACGPSRSVSAGNHSRFVSFQGVILPMLRVICQLEFFNNPASSKVNVTLAAIVEVEGLQEYLISCMRLLTQRGMIRDLSRDDDNITDWDAAFHVIISFFNLSMDRFYSLFDAAQASNDMQEVEGMLEKWQREKPVFDGKYHSIRSVIYRLRKSLDRRQHSERQRQRMEEGQLLHAEFFPSGQHPSSMQAVDGPGELSLDGHPRHDNDHLEISAISVAPTMEEVLCKASPYLPHNHPSEPHHLPAGSVARHVDIQFRLLRHDLIAPLWSKALFLFHRLNHESSRGARGGNSSGSGGGGKEDAMGLLRADRELVRGLTDDMKGVVGFSSEDMDVYLLRDVHVLSINTDKRSGVYFLIDFLEPPMPRGRNARNSLGPTEDMKGVVGFSSEDMDMYLLCDVCVLSINTDKRSGVYFLIDFLEPPMPRGRHARNRVEFWDNTRRLQNGSLVCLWIRDTQRSRQAAAGSSRRQQPLPPAGDTSASDSSSHRLVFATITARDTKRLATARPQIGVQPCGENGFSADLLGLIAQDGSGGRGGSKGVQVVMLEAHGSFFAYEPILKALQSITDASLPFSEYICGAAGGSPGGAPGGAPGRAPGAYKLPAYIKGGMTYDLSLLLKTKVPSSSSQQPQNTAEDEFAMRNVMISSPTAFPMDALLRCTSLDEPQSVALRAALTQEFALLQGPPGTGKTFVGIKLVEILLSNPLKSSSAGHFARGRELASSAGPILCVCFTNHALDQFLEGLIASGIKNVVRVGGRSKSEVLQEYNLLNIIRTSNLDRSRTYRQSSYEVGSKLREVEEVIGTYSDALQQRSDNVAAVAWGTLSSHLMANHPVYFQALRTTSKADADGYEALRTTSKADADGYEVSMCVCGSGWKGGWAALAWGTLSSHLMANHPVYFQALRTVSKADKDGFDQVGRENWKRWKQGLPKETLRRKKGAADMWGDQGHASGRGKGGGGGRAGGPPQGGGVGAGGVGIAASGQQAGIQNAFDALGFLGEFEVGEGWVGASSARDGGVSEELSEMVGMMATFYEGDGSGDGDEAAGRDGSWLGLVPSGRASGAGRAGGAAGAGGFPVEQDLSHAFGDLGIHNGRQGHGTNQPHCQGSSKGKKGGRQEHGSKGKEEEVVEEEEVWTGPEVDERSDRGVDELLGLEDPWATSGRERRKLVESWVGELRATATAAIKAEVANYSRWHGSWVVELPRDKIEEGERERSELQWVEDVQVLKRAQVVGMTFKPVPPTQKVRERSELQQVEDLQVLRSAQVVGKVRERSELQQVEDLQVLRRAQVVGMTTSGVAKMQHLITALGPRVIIVEEAAEVLEAHILTSLTPQTQHVILIGLGAVGGVDNDVRGQGSITMASLKAKMQRLITALGPRVIIVEEAAEVLEAHILTSLTPQTQHIILIGDHLQLRPKVEVYELSKDSHKGFDLDVSLFERLALSRQIPVYTLATQRRMRPEIADLIRYTIYPDLRDHPFVQGYVPSLSPLASPSGLGEDSHKGLALSKQIPMYTLAMQRRLRPEIADLIRYTIYPDLRDHPFVQGCVPYPDILRMGISLHTWEWYPDVRGMAANLHFWDHNFPETGGDDLREGKSKSNAGEAAMVVALATYLLQQGYTGGEVTILTPYVGQLLKLRQALSQVVNVRLGEGDAEVVEEAEEKAATREGGTEGDEAGNGLVAGKGKGLGLEFAAPKAVTANLKDAVRLATVDNFQGEESTVIIISLVRNNGDGKIGFLKSPNRTNVLLSRAKHGMYIIGNASTMRAATSKSVLWPRIMDMLESKGRVEKSIPLRCVNHPDTVTHIERAGEFKEKASEGGCSQMCGFRLTPCGHTCPRRCHGDDRAHANAFCPKECNRIRPLEECPHQHTCPKQCGEACGPCLVTIRALTLPCGHQAFNVPCFKAQNPASIFCSFTVEVTMPLCGHKQTVKCGEAATRVANPKLCTARCGVFLSDSCGHTCISPCGHCIVAPANTTTNQGRGLQHQLHQQQQQPQQQQQQQQQLEKTHKKCTQPCKRPHPCAHLCPDPCHSGTPCKPCTRKCLVACQHSSCPQPCHRTCAPCAEPCGWHCKHQGWCSLPCGAPCDRLPCEQRCEKKLKCGHQCPSLCSEKCPPKGFCTVEGCGEEQKREMTVDLVTLETLGEIDPDESPVLVLPCGHAYTVETLDGHLGLNQVYQEAEDGSAGGSSAAGAGAGGGVGGSAGKWVAVRPFDDGGLSALKGCPECRQPITGLRRYGRMVNKALLDESERKFALSCLADQQQLQTKLSKLSQAISACPEAAQPRQLQELARAATSLVLQANKVRVAAMEPPTQQTYQASVAALQRKHLHLGSLSSSSGADAADSPADAPEASPEKQPADSPAGLTVSAWEEECQLLYVPQPQTGPLCEALLLLGKAYQLLMTANFLQLRCLLTELHKLSRQNAARTAVLTAGLAAGHTDKNSTGREEFLARKVKNCREVVRKGLRNAERHVGEAVEWAGKRRAHRLEAKGRLEMADVFRAFVEGMMAERLLSTSPAGLDDSKEQQLEFLERAKMQCLMVASHHLVSVRENDSLGGSARRMLEKDLHELELSVRDEPRYFAVTEREKADVYEAIGLGGGHWYRCPNGHVYVIGDCGMAMQESRCPECGAAVGGGSHRLRADNTTAAGFFSRS